ncbi:MAG: ABC transporter ATP-binding protein [Steroidobacteraceae bacterium]|jgi:sulfate transport system ATP-binding protein|nr:ABC transporter ATP-binding protein [Steroidobacteraceae bacterium]
MSIKFEQVTKRYQAGPVVNDVTLDIATGEFFVLLGPSGSGKSTLLRALAGLTDIQHGRILLGGRDVTHVPARERGVGFVFQHYALFRHMTVAENIEFALRVRGVRAAARRKRSTELLKLVALEGFGQRKPAQLSGGQQQRVAVARALAHEPAVLVLDEPFGALDAKIRVELRDTVREVQRRLGTTTILVTHDQEEAFTLADRIGVMHMGRLLETGTPQRLYRQPTTRFVATFLGAANLLLAQRTAEGLRFGHELAVPFEYLAALPGHRDEVVAVVRPEDVEVAESAERLAHRAFTHGHVHSSGFAGSFERLVVQAAPDSGLRTAIGHEGPGEAPLRVEVLRTAAESATLPLAPGKRVVLGLRRFHVLPTPISGVVLCASDAARREALRGDALVQQLVGSMKARVIDADDDGVALASAGTLAVAGREPPAPASAGSGLRVVPGDADAVLRLARALGHGGAVLALPPGTQLPSRALLLCTSDGARPATLGVLASVMRHLPVEATYVTVQLPTAPRAEVTASFRRLLDARAELQAAHGLDVRTEVHIGDVDGWIVGLLAAEDAPLLVLGTEATAAELAGLLAGPLRPLFQAGARLPLLLALAAARPAASAAPASALAGDYG